MRKDQPHEPLDDDDFTVEVTPLSASPAQPRRLRGRHSRPVRVWFMLLTVVLLLGVLLLPVSGLSPLQSARAVLFPAATPTSAVAPWGEAPGNCPPGNPVYWFSPEFPNGLSLGRNPEVWLVGFLGPHATLEPQETPGPNGYPADLLVVFAPDVSLPVTFAARPLSGTGGRVLWSTPEPRAQPRPSITLDPLQGQLSRRGYRSMNVHVYLRAAGCYYLDVSGTPGTFFAAGK